VPFTQTTDLGRRVLLDDWRGFHRDRLLCVLCQLRDLHSLGDRRSGLSRREVEQLTGLGGEQTLVLLRWMTEDRPRLLTLDVRCQGEPGGVYRISSRGARWVDESPGARASLADLRRLRDDLVARTCRGCDDVVASEDLLDVTMHCGGCRARRALPPAAGTASGSPP
jgi:hypothetical protein